MTLGKKGQQLQMFMDAESHIASVTGSSDTLISDTFDPNHMDTLWRKKEAEARAPLETLGHGSGIYDSIKKHGMQSQVVVVERPDGSWFHGEGHHRAAAARAIQRDTGTTQWVYPHYVPHDVARNAGSRAASPINNAPPEYDERRQAQLDVNFNRAMASKKAGKRKAMGLS